MRIYKEWKVLHDELGCAGCSYANPDKVNIDACCTISAQLEIDKSGRCINGSNYPPKL